MVAGGGCKYCCRRLVYTWLQEVGVSMQEVGIYMVAGGGCKYGCRCVVVCLLRLAVSCGVNRPLPYHSVTLSIEPAPQPLLFISTTPSPHHLPYHPSNPSKNFLLYILKSAPNRPSCYHSQRCRIRTSLSCLLRYTTEPNERVFSHDL